MDKVTGKHITRLKWGGWEPEWKEMLLPPDWGHAPVRYPTTYQESIVLPPLGVTGDKDQAASVAGTGSSGAAASTAGHLAPFQPASLPDTGQLRPVKCAVQSFHRTGIPFFLRVVDEMPLLKSRYLDPDYDGTTKTRRDLKAKRACALDASLELVTPASRHWFIQECKLEDWIEESEATDSYVINWDTGWQLPQTGDEGVRAVLRSYIGSNTDEIACLRMVFPRFPGRVIPDGKRRLHPRCRVYPTSGSLVKHDKADFDKVLAGLLKPGGWGNVVAVSVPPGSNIMELGGGLVLALRHVVQAEALPRESRPPASEPSCEPRAARTRWAKRPKIAQATAGPTARPSASLAAGAAAADPEEQAEADELARAAKRAKLDLEGQASTAEKALQESEPQPGPEDLQHAARETCQGPSAKRPRCSPPRPGLRRRARRLLLDAVRSGALQATLACLGRARAQAEGRLAALRARLRVLLADSCRAGELRAALTRRQEQRACLLQEGVRSLLKCALRAGTLRGALEQVIFDRAAFEALAGEAKREIPAAEAREAAVAEDSGEAAMEVDEPQVPGGSEGEDETAEEVILPEIGAAERDAYVAHFRCLLEMERQAEEAQVLERLRRPLMQLESLGVSCSGLWPEFRPGDVIVLTRRSRGIPSLPEVSPGRTVLLTAQGDQVSLSGCGSTAGGEVLSISSREIVVQCGAKLRGPLRLDSGPNGVAQRRLSEVLVALERGGSRPGEDPWRHGLGLVTPSTPLASALFASAPGAEATLAARAAEAPPDEQASSPGPPATPLPELARQQHYSTPSPPWVSYPSGMYRAANDRLRRHLERPPEAPLNPSQQRAVAVTARERRQLALIQGPPGTGKTATAIEVIVSWLRASRGPILATAFTNKGVDNLAEGLWLRGVNVVRIGACSPDLPYSEASHMKAFGFDRGTRNRKLFQDMLGGAHVACATCIGVGMGILEGASFPYVVIDEAAQVVEPAALIPLSHGSVQAVQVGDQCQLPATVVSREAEQGGLATSLFERLVDQGVDCHMLSVPSRVGVQMAMGTSSELG
ncbi:unnamed protein product [Prorocentrum cordatum]|uniref:DNA2/NAM7 helicase helicase domain-containing protein n=1 Tax=Prorocentrum cordatum TaxID=2364126 RepID=A0ABN9Y313_9DINO|nr:unnamed protein product [Polarella glacialis]